MSSNREATEFDAEIGARVKAIRKAAGVSQEALAEATGVTFQQVQKWERGKNRMSAERLRDAAKALGVSVAVLFGEEPPGGEMLSRVERAFATMPKPAVESWVASLEAVARGSTRPARGKK